MLLFLFFLMKRRPPRSTRTDTLFPYTTLFRSDPEKARALLKEAGLENGFSFELLAYPRSPEAEMATTFQAAAREVGVDVKIVGMPGSQDRKSTRLNSSH